MTQRCTKCGEAGGTREGLCMDCYDGNHTLNPMGIRDELAATAPVHYQQARRAYGAEMPVTVDGMEGFMAVWATLRYAYADAALKVRERPQEYEFQPDQIPLMVEMLSMIQLLNEDITNMIKQDVDLSYRIGSGEAELPQSLQKSRTLLSRIKDQGKWEQAKIEKPDFAK